MERIGLRSTRIRTIEQTLVTVPNKQMVDSVVDNLSMRNQRRAEIKLVLSDKTKPDQVQKLIDAVKTVVIENQDNIVKNSVFVTDFNKDGVTITIEYFTLAFTMQEFNILKQHINFKLMYLMEEFHLEMSSTSGNITIVNADADAAPKQQPIL